MPCEQFLNNLILKFNGRVGNWKRAGLSNIGLSANAFLLIIIKNYCQLSTSIFWIGSNAINKFGSEIQKIKFQKCSFFGLDDAISSDSY